MSERRPERKAASLIAKVGFVETPMHAARVLIVEDDPMMAMHLEALVGDTLGSEVEVSASVAEAEVAILHRPDFALLDVDVTDGKTYALASRLVDARIPFAFVSASDRGELPAALRTIPFVAKPYEDREIVGLLNAFGRHRGA